VSSSWLIDCVRRILPAGAVPDPAAFREALTGQLADLRKPRGIRHQLASLVSAAVGGVAAGHGGPLAIARAAAGWGQEVLAAHGYRADEDHDQNSSADLDAIIAEEDKLPEPRTRQEVAEQEQSGDDPLIRTSDETSHRADGERDAGRQEDADRWPTPEERAHLHETYLDWRQEVSAGREQGMNVVGDKPDRSPDDRSDLPPTGEELVNMESDSMSRFDRLRNHIYKQADDITDVAEKTGNRALELWERPPTETHTEIPSGRPEITNPAPPALDGGQFVLASLTVGMLGYELLRAVKNRVNTWKGDSHGSK